LNSSEDDLLESEVIASSEPSFAAGIFRISWKLLRAARETSAFWQRAADSMYSSKNAQARRKSPDGTVKKATKKNQLL
jgi:hypothetical protein